MTGTTSPKRKTSDLMHLVHSMARKLGGDAVDIESSHPYSYFGHTVKLSVGNQNPGFLRDQMMDAFRSRGFVTPADLGGMSGLMKEDNGLKCYVYFEKVSPKDYFPKQIFRVSVSVYR